MKPIVKSYLVEVNLGSTVPGVGSNLLFQDYPQLRDVYLMSAVVYDTNTLTTSPAGKTVITATGGITLTLMDRYNQEIIRSYPSVDLNPYYNAGFYRDLRPFPLQLTKSFITIQNITGLNANESFVMNIFYITDKEYKSIKNV